MEKIKTYIYLALLTGSIMACEKGLSPEVDEKDKMEVDSAMLRAEALFIENCSGCHGALMQGFVDRKWVYGNSEDSLTNTIKYGRSDGEMPAFGSVLSNDQISELVSFIRYGIDHMDEYSFDNEVHATDTFSTEGFEYVLEPLAEDLWVPWGLTFLPDGRALITDRNGSMYLIDNEKNKIELSGVPKVKSKGQGGLLDVELHPDFATNGWIYLSYSAYKTEGNDTLSTTFVSRYQLNGQSLESGEDIFNVEQYSTKRHHYGSRLEFDRDGFLYITIGDRGKRDVNPQDKTRYPGKIHRIHDDGRIPGDNPFVAGNGEVQSIYSYGHRNPQGLALHPVTGALWSHEHGPRGGDELNQIKKGLNYGWPVISYGINYDGTVFTTETEKEGMEQPIHYWVPSIGPSGMDFIEGDTYPGWEGHLLVGSLRYKYLDLVKLDGNTIIGEEKLIPNLGRVRNVRVGPDGYIYVAVEKPGAVYKIVPLL